VKTVRDLIEELTKFPADCEVSVLGQGISEGCECDPTASFWVNGSNERVVLIHEIEGRMTE
jgi:hypothetical protein